eukprot:TRINITY_DN90702_c0_g1_i1.p1 TRINITY_DN90702_c0_g1~~TRINITY_DN90702_c0_g1_i1.p1  ORF type:complete len:536 (+),score=33.09 TRINITY_DN90702_c0_g1_i1:35-1642(+)
MLIAASKCWPLWLPQLSSHAEATCVESALQGKPSQSSTYSGGCGDALPCGPASFATDGKLHTLSHTNGGPNQWWQLDLGSVKQVSSIRIWNRNDHPSEGRRCEARFFGGECPSMAKYLAGFPYDSVNQGAHVGVSMKPCSGYKCSGKRCGKKITARQPEEIYEIQCGGLSGRYVYIQLPGPYRSLNLREVKVYECSTSQTADSDVSSHADAETQSDQTFDDTRHTDDPDEAASNEEVTDSQSQGSTALQNMLSASSLEVLHRGRFCCDQSPCEGGHSSFLFEGAVAVSDCLAKCVEFGTRCKYITLHAGGGQYCQVAEFCDESGVWVGSPEETTTYFAKKLLLQSAAQPAEATTDDRQGIEEASETFPKQPDQAQTGHMHESHVGQGLEMRERHGSAPIAELLSEGTDRAVPEAGKLAAKSFPAAERPETGAGVQAALLYEGLSASGHILQTSPQSNKERTPSEQFGQRSQAREADYPLSARSQEPSIAFSSTAGSMIITPSSAAFACLTMLLPMLSLLFLRRVWWSAQRSSRSA